MAENSRRTGLFGGSFNPPTIAHKALADFAFSAAKMDRLLWVVTPHNPEKDPATLAPFPDRVNMVDLAIQGHPGMESCDIEQRLGSSYTLNTLKALRKEMPDDYLFFLMGTDNWLGFHTWDEDYKEIMDYASIIVLQRPGYDLASQAKASHLFQHQRVDQPDLLGKSGNWCIVENPQIDMAATYIRHAIQNGKTPEGIADNILEYIRAHDLYGIKQD